MTKAFTAFYDEVMPELPGASPALVLKVIKDVCRDFHERSFCEQDTLPIDLLTGVPSYALTITDPVNYELVQVLGVKYNDQPLDPASPLVLDREEFEWKTRAGSVRRYTMDDASTIRFVSVPQASETGTVQVQVAITPLEAGAGISDDIFRTWKYEIARGVIGRLQIMARKPWSDANMSEMNRHTYEQAIGGAALKMLKGHGAGPLRTRSYG